MEVQNSLNPVQSDLPHELPEPGRHVIVMTRRFRCVGHIDELGNWRGITGTKISDVVDWEPL